MRRFPWCIPSWRRSVRNEDSDSERAESPAFVGELDPIDVPFGKLKLRESPDSYPASHMTDLWRDKSTRETLPVSRLWRDETHALSQCVSTHHLLALATDPALDDAPATRRHTFKPAAWKPANDETVTMSARDRTFTRPIRGFPSYKDAEKRKNPGADLPAEKKARTEPSSYSVAPPESESD